MKKYFRFLFAALYATGLFFVLTSCQKEIPEIYKKPPWLGGSSIETLKERGNYTMFLSLMDKANYTEPIDKQLFTLFVPNDSAFTVYLQSIGKTSIDEFTQDEAVQLFTLHVLRNPLSRYYLIYEFVWNEFQGPKGEYASLFHRKVTPSKSIPYNETIKYLPGRENENILIYTGTKNVPLWSDEFFNDFGGAKDGSDYTFMYPGSTWKKGYGLDENGIPLKGLNWHNAMVLPNPMKTDELEVRTASGFIYFVDRVVPPMPSMEEYLRNNPEKFGLFYDMMQRFANYNSKFVDKDKRVMWKKSYDLLFNIAEEVGPENPPKPKRMFSGFVPSNDVMQAYLDNSVMKYYPSLDSVPKITLFYILQSQLSEALVLVSKMEQSYFNPFGDAIKITRDDLVGGYMCSNGAVYQSKKIFDPNVFRTVPGELFFDKNYSTLLFALNDAKMLATVSNPEEDVTLFATTNDKLEEYGIRYNETKSILEFRGPVDGKWNAMNVTDETFFAQDQIIKGRLSDFSGAGGYMETSSGNYIHYGANMVEGSENIFKGNPGNVIEVKPNAENGFLVKLDKPVESRYLMGKYLMSDPDVSEFAHLLCDAKLLDSAAIDSKTKEPLPNLKFIASTKYWTAFIPTNAAMAQARLDSIIPATYPTATAEKDAVNSFIMYHFVKNDVIFDDGLKAGTFSTNSTYKDPVDLKTVLNYTLQITNSPNNLSVTDITGQVVEVDHATANILVRKGVVHKINSVLKH
jgi:uncharacterized surface protein with fasciclin (FAS1) repeats